ncbi:hypothetical protein CEXT_378561 [Caerostris extrusa]|uniref:Secreted protein n=1 Tax=Caerostris extrusa TaxID=172846 RepID=A0AAV4UR13_CAEEX|nr:hypothetical protein CEXT_378561 [Caerostris extrusa]
MCKKIFFFLLPFFLVRRNLICSYVLLVQSLTLPFVHFFSSFEEGKNNLLTLTRNWPLGLFYPILTRPLFPLPPSHNLHSFFFLSLEALSHSFVTEGERPEESLDDTKWKTPKEFSDGLGQRSLCTKGERGRRKKKTVWHLGLTPSHTHDSMR